MNTVETPRLEDVLSDAAPRLDFALVNGPINEHIGCNRKYSTQLVRRGGVCQPSSELLEMYLSSQGVKSGLYTKEIYVTHRNRDQYLGGHVLLKLREDNGRAIDSTWQQYLCLVGLSAWKVQNDPSLMELYPESKIAVIECGSTEFADDFAEYAHELDTQDVIPRVEGEHPLHIFLRGTTLDEKVAVYRKIWDLENYKSFSQRTKLGHALAQSVAVMGKCELLAAS